MRTNFRWDIFLNIVNNNQIIPVVGSDLTLLQSRKNEIKPLHEWMKLKLSTKLQKEAANLNFREFVLENKEEQFLQESILNSFNEVFKECTLVGEPLRKLARITDFRFFISTTFDKCFESILKSERGLKDDGIVEIEYSNPCRVPKAYDEIERRVKEGAPVVFKFLGSMNNRCCAITEDEILEYIFSLKNENQLAKFLSDAVDGKNLLFVGNNFPDWLLRFFIRIITNEAYVMCKTSKIIAENYAHKNPNLSMFLEHFRTQFLSLTDVEFDNPREFVNVLYANWLTYKEEKTPKRYRGSVFLSFNHKDRDTIKEIWQELEANGIEAWFDENELYSGDNHRQLITQRIKECDVFVAFLSDHSVTNPDSYVYSVEWDLAMARRKVREDDSAERSFICPVIIDDITTIDERIPELMRRLTIEKLDTRNLIDNLKKRLTLITDE